MAASSIAAARPCGEGGSLYKMITSLRVAIAATAIALSAACAALAVTPAKDLFSSRVATASGAYRSDTGASQIAVVPGSGSKVTITLRGASCRGKRRCVAPSGTLRGTMTRTGALIPDIGMTYAVAASGRLTSIGAVRATGTLHGTGFIMHGHESLVLTLTTTHGTIQLSGESRSVPGFSHP
jgi:hypothetical protein